MRQIVINSPETKANAHNVLRELANDKKWRISIEEWKRNRSKAQNRLYWKWVEIISDQTGYTKEEIHALFRLMFLGTRTVHVMGRDIEDLRSTADLNTKEFTDYLNEIEVFTGAEIGIALPHPIDSYYEAMGK